MSAIITMSRLRKEFDDLVAVEGLDVSIPAGEIYASIGPNGAGKTTTIRMACGLLEPTEGHVTISCVDVHHDPERAQQFIGYLADFFSVYEDLKVWEYLDFFANAYKMPEVEIPSRINEVIRQVELEVKRDALIRGLSRGMKQRLGIARAIIHKPRVLLLDEPASGLDPKARLDLRNLLRSLRDGGTTVLIAMGCWSADKGHAQEFFRDFYAWLDGSQFVLLGVWSAATCGQSVARERELKTFDFLKITRLTPAEIMVGKLLGAPIVAYFIIACTLPISLVAGLAGGVRPSAVLGSMVLLIAFNLCYSLAALLLSMLVEKNSSGAVILLGLLATYYFMKMFVQSPFKGFAAISVLPALFSLHGFYDVIGHTSPAVFGMTVSWAILSLVLYVLLGAWLVLMIVRNLKRDIPQIQLLSRWQGVGLVAFWNLLFYAFLDIHSIQVHPVPLHIYHLYYFASEIASYAVGWNALFLFLVGIAALEPPEKLKIWWRKWKAGEGPYFSSDGLPLPWLVAAAIIGYAMLAGEALGLRSVIPLGEWHLSFAAVAFAAFLVFTARDVLFLQWCLLTRMKHPVIKGILFIVLYNGAATILGVMVSVFASPEAMKKVLTFLMPYALLGEMIDLARPPRLIFAALALQLGICALILLAIQRRLARPVHAPAAP